jgi:hypothetical protein
VTSPALQALIIVSSGTNTSVAGRFGVLEGLLDVVLKSALEMPLPLLLRLLLLFPLLDVGTLVLYWRSAALNSASISSKLSAGRAFFLLRFACLSRTRSAGEVRCVVKMEGARHLKSGKGKRVHAKSGQKERGQTVRTWS